MSREQKPITPDTQYGELLTIREATKEDWINGRQTWLCLCECGVETLVRASSLKKRTVQTCVIHKRNNSDILPGTKYNRLTTVRRTADNKKEWLCLCDCGKERVVGSALLLNGKAISCGCSRKKHGGWGSLTYKRWTTMKQRCNNYCFENRRYYGKVTICDEWQSDYTAFLRDMGECPSDKHTLDRIDNNKGYEPSNCRWATITEQARNKTNTIRIGDTSARDYAESLGLNPDKFVARLTKGCSLEEAVSTEPLNPARSRQKFTREQVISIRNRVEQGESQTKIAIEYGVTHGTINHIIARRNYKDIE